MFVTKKRYDSLLAQAAQMELERIIAGRAHRELAVKWNDPVEKINTGHYVLASSRPQGAFTADEIETLVRLCHPDKHGGSKAANEMTQRLLALRKKG